MSRRWARAACALFIAAAGAGGWLAAAGSDDPLGIQTGGAVTVHATGRNAFSFPFVNLDDAERTRFAIGNSFFRRNWVEAPASTTARDGLGPHFIARSCGGCHVQDGRGAPPDFNRRLGPHDEPTVALLMRLSVPGPADPKAGVRPEPVYGDQFNNAAVQGVKPEGQVRIQRRPVQGRFADGTRYTLQQPTYTLTDLGYGPLAPGVMLGPRIAPQLAGVGLLEAIDEADILANAAAQAAAPGPIKGQPNRVWDAVAGTERIGRLGWKANVASIAHQTAGAFLGDMGITSPVFPHEACTAAQADCLAAPHGGGKRGGAGGIVTAAQASAAQPEIDQATFDDVVFYQATLAPAARRGANDPQVLRGQALFAQAQCATCHRPSYITQAGPFPRLTSPKANGQRIWPYTDLLLHDMGPGLADGRPDFQASGSQWKTPPLWGIGLIRDVNGHQRLLHDGRADGVLEAVLWHGGEAEEAKQQVLQMKRADRQALVKFVESL
ncbi:di-heme oxidoredictase family protein [Ottowia testudinis]|uniref:C-type cytochrome n=1 Tax=Ottowia testudinis TaxID=2816950 RepID=A0A975CIC6_9BURK|nr:di-heme oxidoredictase family protein [Ottowia testudinis]QTD46356.1 c-type cytochrome [Ottowia testudinis]